MEQRVSLLTLGVRDLERAAQFYEALGWERTESGSDGIRVFDCLGQVVGLYPIESLAKDLGMPVPEVGFSGMTLGYNVREKDEVAEIYQAAVAAGAKGLKPPHDIFWGGHSAFFADPDGHVWEISHNPYSPPREDGSFQWGG
ncbi:MAG: VOC family protein [Shimia sp.]